MTLVRILAVKPLHEFNVELRLTNGEVVQRDLRHLLSGSIFEGIRRDEKMFRQVRADEGSLVWPGGVDLCPDAVIWGGLPPADAASCAA